MILEPKIQANNRLAYLIDTSFTQEEIQHLSTYAPVTGANGIRRYLAQQSFTNFIGLYFGDMLTVALSESHLALFRDIEDIIQRLQHDQSGVRKVYALPRGWGKSTYLTKLMPLYCFLFGISPLTLLIANNQVAAGRLMKNIRDTIDSNPAIQEDFPNLKGAQWGIERIDSNEGHSIIGYGMGSGAIRGISAKTRPSLVLLDDIDDDASVRSAIELAANKEFFDKTVMYLGDNVAHTTTFVMIGTIIRRTSLLNYVIDSVDFNATVQRTVLQDASNTALWDAWRNWILSEARQGKAPATPDDDSFYQGNKAEMLEGSKVLWDTPDAYYRAMLAKLRNEKAYYAELQNDPRDSGSVLGIPAIITEIENEHEYDLLAALDPTVAGGKHNDLAAFVEILFHKKRKDIVISYVNAKQRNYNDTINDIAHRIQTRGRQYQGFWCEVNSSGALIRDLLQQTLQSRGIPLLVNPIYNSAPKAERISSLSHYIGTGQLKMLDSVDTQTKQQFEMYPFSANDDILDSLSMIVIELKKLGLLDLV